MVRALFNCVPLILLIGTTIGSLYFGLVTPTEAGAFGALVAPMVGFSFSSSWTGRASNGVSCKR